MQKLSTGINSASQNTETCCVVWSSPTSTEVKPEEPEPAWDFVLGVCSCTSSAFCFVAAKHWQQGPRLEGLCDQGSTADRAFSLYQQSDSCVVVLGWRCGSLREKEKARHVTSPQLEVLRWISDYTKLSRRQGISELETQPGASQAWGLSLSLLQGTTLPRRWMLVCFSLVFSAHDSNQTRSCGCMCMHVSKSIELNPAITHINWTWKEMF